ncbi:protein of unknown function [Pseudobutyrivibrio sp. YE44]|uniref:DUF4153 domain-containing protein n=1 Tax=Pseudobutyrivibrio sp. YE44 TaxID=1520802 RepID=UPI00088E2901|nr:DUF4173 domain-containing protein [Pseudobutyrivibrio sp. YE44]SDB12990.1 protein of unknown function [Pseudobutyrivibrio sp. YE44]
MDNAYNGPKYSDIDTTTVINDNQPVPIYNHAVVEEVKGDKETFKKYGIVSLIFAIVYTFCLYKNHSGITYPIFMAITLGLLHLIRKKDGLSLLSSKNGSKLLGIFYVSALMLLSIHKCMSTSWALQFLDATAIFLLFFSFVLYLYVDTTGWDIAGWLGGIVVSIVFPLFHFAKPFYDFGHWVKSRKGDMDPGKKQTVTAVVIGVVCAIPALMVVVALLSSADLVFSRMLEKMFEAISLPDNFWDIVGIAFTLFFSFMAAYLIPFTMSKGDVKIKARGEGKGNPIIAITFTAILGVVYLVFSLIQVLYLFTGSMELPSGYTYAEYAHEGFYQLLFVCILNLVMVSVCNREFKASKVLTGVLVIIAACTYIMIASSAMRMMLYIGVYHLTFLRLFVLWFLAVLCIWLAFLMVGLFAKKFPIFKACLIAITIAYVGFVFANPDYQIAKYDLKAANGKIDEYESVETYIVDSLSTDAVPALASDKKLLHQFELSNISYMRDNDKDYSGFRKFNFSYYRAQKIFNK